MEVIRTKIHGEYGNRPTMVVNIANMTFENDARVSAFLKFVDWRARLSNRRYVR